MKPFALSLIVAVGTANMLAQAASDLQVHPSVSLYLQDSRGTIARSADGLCWRTGQWTPADAIPGCDGELLPPLTKPTAPDIISPARTTPSPTAISHRRCDFTVILASDETFAFNRATLNSAARKRLDEGVLRKLEDCSHVESILIVGHADQLGSRQYNQRLSERRAGAVAEYLKANGITFAIDTMGAGATQPIRECSTKLPRAQRVDCLSPNRRVTIEVSGLKK
jgi:OOP family OmpA-OmpF porin